ncbi:GFA family protein [Sagittula stellata]|uniref:CENP-V/GFA domain-containing protein n=1 Tax=Sagittula stellata (strain ATCC 700073 / DSM 11524 / E-37) TaxID=388399 RepID=A3KA12_SAGS3|nr:GFA family protein [Sagittula stellata]EBA05955.1 hypothetical protein SSE37_25143 [Sagittula stellata E-37]
MQEEIYDAGCLCGALRVSARGAPLRVGICHCLDCRKHHGAVFYAAAQFEPGQVTVTGPSRNFRGRYFCPTCGGSVFAESDDVIELHLGALDAPDRLQPEYELWTSRRESWLPPFTEMAQFERERDDPDAAGYDMGPSEFR